MRISLVGPDGKIIGLEGGIMPSVIKAPPSQVPGRAGTTITVDRVAGASLLYTVTLNKTLFVTDIILMISNSAALVQGVANLRDGITDAGSIRLPMLVDAGPPSGENITTILASPIEPLRFNIGVFFDVVEGTLTTSGILSGYEEDA